MQEYEAARLAKIKENKQKLQALGIQETAGDLFSKDKDETELLIKAPKRKRSAKAPVPATSTRSSERTRGTVVNYNEDHNDPLRGSLRGRSGRTGGGGDKKFYVKHLDDGDAHEARLAAGVLEGSPSKSTSRKRGPQDSGKGVRIMGGKVYDSTYGVTCHWCRQKTLAESVTCTAPSCGVRRMPYSFCRSCLWNRNGEDATRAKESGSWVCPACRGSCGPGCLSCCNCGPCRKKLGLSPTGQVKSDALADGFTNVHDWLIFREIGACHDELEARKLAAPWGAWMLDSSSDASEDETHIAAGTDTAGQVEAPQCDENFLARSRGNSCPGEDPNETTEKKPQQCEDDASPSTEVLARASSTGEALKTTKKDTKKGGGRKRKRETEELEKVMEENIEEEAKPCRRSRRTRVK